MLTWHTVPMPRQARVAIGGTIYHVINRANGSVGIFHEDKDYQHFESLREEKYKIHSVPLTCS